MFQRSMVSLEDEGAAVLQKVGNYPLSDTVSYLRRCQPSVWWVHFLCLSGHSATYVWGFTVDLLTFVWTEANMHLMTQFLMQKKTQYFSWWHATHKCGITSNVWRYWINTKCFTFNRCIYLLVLESTKIYIKIHTKMLLHVLVCDHHQGARTGA
jgi:hypothetical protein